MFEPVNTVISRLDPKNDAKKQLNMIIDGEGQLCVYRKLPSLRTRIGQLSDIRTMDTKKLRRLLWDRGNTVACADARCAPCRWRYICGGMDPAEETADPSLFETVCDTWQFLLEMLAWERSNVAKTASAQASQ